MPNGAHSASHAAPASQKGQTGRCSDGGANAGLARDQRGQLVQRRHLGAGEDVGAARGARHLAAQAEALDEVVDVRQVVEDPAVAENDESSSRDAAEQLQQAAIAGTIDAARARDDHLDAGARGRVARERSPSTFATW